MVLLDEGGFWTCGLLLFASQAISIAHNMGQDVVFANKDVIISCDFFQNPPPGQNEHSIAEAIILRTLAPPALAKSKAQGAVIEVANMLQTFQRWELTEQVRAKTDATHTAHIMALRNTKTRSPVTAKLLAHYQPLTATDMLDVSWRRSQFVVTTNSERVA